MNIDKSIVRNGALLCLFAIITTALIALTHFGTKDRIQAQQQRKLLSLINEVFPDHRHDNDVIRTCFTVESPLLGTKDAHTVYRAEMGDKVTGFIVSTTAPNGYSGQIKMLVGISDTLEVLGTRVVEHKETPGLGDKIDLSVSDWILSFTNKLFKEEDANQWRVKKDGGQFDQFTGATITPRAVVSSVANTARFVRDNMQSLLNAPATCAAQEQVDG